MPARGAGQEQGGHRNHALGCGGRQGLLPRELTAELTRPRTSLWTPDIPCTPGPSHRAWPYPFGPQTPGSTFMVREAFSEFQYVKSGRRQTGGQLSAGPSPRTPPAVRHRLAARVPCCRLALLAWALSLGSHQRETHGAVRQGPGRGEVLPTAVSQGGRGQQGSSDLSVLLAAGHITLELCTPDSLVSPPLARLPGADGEWGSAWDHWLRGSTQEGSRAISMLSGALPLPARPWAHLCRRL